MTFLQHLKERGWKGVRLLVSDKGLELVLANHKNFESTRNDFRTQVLV